MLVVLILVLFALGVADARVPQVGDQVKIVTALGTSGSGGLFGAEFNGKITDIGDGLICLSCTSGIVPNQINPDSSHPQPFPFDVCIGVGSIASLTWST